MLRPKPFVAMLPALIVAIAWLAPAAAELATADSVRKYRFLGKTARDKEDHKDVVFYYGQLLAYQPDYQLGHYYLGRAHMALGEADAAKRSFLSATALDSTHANTNLLLFQLYMGQTQPDSAWVYLGRLVRDQPTDPRYLEYRDAVADLYRRTGQVDKAIDHYTALAESEAVPVAERRQFYELLAVMHTDAGNPAAALAWRQRLVGGDGPVDVESLSKMVDLQVDTKDYRGAFQTLQALARLDSAGRYSHFLRMAEMGTRASDPAVRLAGLEGMARTQPRDVETVATLAEIHLNDGNLAVAARWIDRGIGGTKDNAQFYVLRGDLLKARKAPEDDVIAAYETALGDPNWAAVAQQRIWQIRPPETEEEKLKRAFFGGVKGDGGS